MARARKSKSKQATTGGPGGSAAGATQSGEGETTGRFIIIFKDEAVRGTTAVKMFLASTAGIANVAIAADCKDSAVDADDLSATQSLYFDLLGIAVVSGEDASIQNFSMAAADAIGGSKSYSHASLHYRPPL